eukprot:COSAG03_NODE_123_length_12291_cov_19.979413_13_plen_66_part_00
MIGRLENIHRNELGTEVGNSVTHPAPRGVFCCSLAAKNPGEGGRCLREEGREESMFGNEGEGGRR